MDYSSCYRNSKLTKLLWTIVTGKLLWTIVTGKLLWTIVTGKPGSISFANLFATDSYEMSVRTKNIALQKCFFFFVPISNFV